MLELLIIAASGWILFKISWFALKVTWSVTKIIVTIFLAASVLPIVALLLLWGCSFVLLPIAVLVTAAIGCFGQGN